jgi:gamma-glutamylcyclotransferase (GGCT)/AIG2-like uncharacterized protein YtfP
VNDPRPHPVIPPSGSTLALFVYGTLMRGQANHRRFCTGALSIRPATVRATLYHLPAGYPAITVDPREVLARGSADIVRDLTIDLGEQEEVDEAAAGSQNGLVHGEVIRFDDGVARLAAIDRLEGFRPGGGLYDRVLVRAYVEGAALPVWTYVQSRPRGTRLPEGRWRPVDG